LDIVSKSGTYHHGDLRRALLDASVALLEEVGVGALSLREVARKAEVSHNAPYHHFPDKGTLLAAIAEDGHAELAREMREARLAAATPRARLEASGLAYVRFALRRPSHFRVMCRPELASQERLPQITRLAASAFDLLVESIKECQASGDAPPGDPMPLVLACWTCVHGLATLWLDGSLSHGPHGVAADPDGLASTLVKVLSDMLSAAAGRAEEQERASTSEKRRRVGPAETRALETKKKRPSAI
jgi:AcrR family transcriptional regulator